MAGIPGKQNLFGDGGSACLGRMAKKFRVAIFSGGDAVVKHFRGGLAKISGFYKRKLFNTNVKLFRIGSSQIVKFLE